MGERKVIQRFISPEFDPALMKRMKQPKSKKSKLDISVVNEAIAAMYQKDLLELK